MTTPDALRQEVEELVEEIKNSLAYSMISSEEDDVRSLLLTSLTRARQQAQVEAAARAQQLLDQCEDLPAWHLARRIPEALHQLTPPEMP